MTNVFLWAPLGVWIARILKEVTRRFRGYQATYIKANEYIATSTLVQTSDTLNAFTICPAIRALSVHLHSPPSPPAALTLTLQLEFP